jgi:BolA protein
MKFVGPVGQSIHTKLVAAFDPIRLEVVDDSHRHAGHAGHNEGGESHFNLLIVSDAFVGLGRVERQRRVHQVLSEELAGPVHALSIKASTSAEAEAAG